VLPLLPLLLLLLWHSGVWAQTAVPHSRPPVSTFRIPELATFCGENVPLDRADVRERLEREFYNLLDHEGQLVLYIKRAARTGPVVEPILKAQGVPDDLKFVPVVESGLLFRAHSSARAVGYWQFLEPTAKRYGLRVDRYVDERRSLAHSTRAAVAYLKQLHAEFGSWATALAAYNWGEMNVRTLVETQGTRHYYDLYMPDETERFVFKILTLKRILEAPEAYAIHVPEDQKYRLPATTDVPLTLERHVPMQVLSTCADTPPRTLRHLNPWMMRNELPAGKHPFTLPQGKETGFDLCVTRHQAVGKEIVHVVGKGESLGTIAQRYGVSVRDIETWNRLSRNRPIHPGQRLILRPRD